ncbi:MAG: hypothetical protein JNK48_19060, partial [Bryobacterales bacterium]|nr:hypothetical protein [Bryobacterales bacterium]
MPDAGSLGSPKMMGGIIAAKGFDFQTRYAACKLREWLDEGLEQLMLEGSGDIDLRFRGPVRHHIQVKDHEVKPAEFKEVIAQFREIDASRLGVFERYILACTGLSDGLRAVENGLARYRNAMPFYDDVPEALAPTREDLARRLEGYDSGFLMEKVFFDVGHGDLHRDAYAERLFVGQRGRPGRDAYARLLRTLSSHKGVPLGRETLESVLGRTEEETPRVDLTPPVPGAGMVGRPAALEEIRRKVLAGRGGHIALTAVEGMGGIGKTVLAQMLCEDSEIRREFPDGVFWFTVGRESMVEPGVRARQVAQALGSQRPYREAVREKAILLVLDDVWSAAPVEAVRAISPRSTVLFTTREKRVAAELGAEAVTVQLLDAEESRQVLAKAAAMESRPLPGAAAEMIRECNGQALALAMLGKALRGRPAARWDTALQRLRSADPDVIPQVFAISLDALDDRAMQERYVGLAVLLEDMRITLPVLRTLWGTDEEEAARTADVFVDHSLAT